MAISVSQPLRINKDNVAAFDDIIEFCNEHEICFNALMNSFIKPIAHAVTHHVFVSEEEDTAGQLYVRSDFGDVPIIEHGQKGKYETEFSSKKKKRVL